MPCLNCGKPLCIWFNNWREKYWWIILICIAITVFVTPFYIVSLIDNDCSHSQSFTGFLNGMESESFLIIDNDTWFVSDYFWPDCGMPVDFYKYFGHHVEITYTGGCGRNMITNIKIINN